MTRTTILGLLVVVTSHQIGDCALVNQGPTTLDKVTNLQWLDLTTTQNYPNNYSFNAVVNMLGPGQLFDGWRIPTKMEVDTFFDHAGIPVPINFTFQNFDFTSGDTFINLFGQTGLIGFPPTERASGGIVQLTTGARPTFAAYEVQSGFLDNTEPISRVRRETVNANNTGGFGTFLVRTVPEPTSFLAAGIGLLGILELTRRRT